MVRFGSTLFCEQENFNGNLYYPFFIYVLTCAANRNASKSRLVAATLCAGLYPQLGKILRPTKRFVEVMGNAVERDLLVKHY